MTSRSQSLDVLRVILRICLGITLLALIAGVALARPQRDFIEYWTAAHLFVTGQNCYSLPDVLHFQQVLGWPDPLPLIPLNQPWLLPLVAPMGFARSYAISWAVWSLIMAGALALSSVLLMQLYAPDVRLPGISDSFTNRALFVFSFYPAILSVRFAQISGLILLGIAGFLWLQRKGHSMLAGSVLALAALKPQLVYLAFLAIAVDCYRRRSARTVLGFATAITLLIGVVAVVNPSLFLAYWKLSSGPYPRLYPSAVGAILRIPFGAADTFYLQLMPVIFGLGWFIHYLRRDVRLEDAMPTLIAVSLLTTPWGWLFDEALLAISIVAIFAATVRARAVIPRRALWSYTALNGGFIIASLLKSTAGTIAYTAFYPVAPIAFILTLQNRSWPARLRSPAVGIEAH